MRRFFISLGVLLVWGFLDYILAHYLKFTLMWPGWAYVTFQWITYQLPTVVLAWLWGAPVVGITVWLLWWTWWQDAAYYLFYDTLLWWGTSNAWEREVLGGEVTWAEWTPWGIVTRLIPGQSDVPIPAVELFVQMGIGMVAAFVLCVYAGRLLVTKPDS